MHHRMDELVDSVREAVHEAEAAGARKEVVDLGQSLSLLETKFAGLRAALSAELGAKSKKFSSNADVAKELMDRSSELVRVIVDQRNELKQLSGDIKQVDSAIRAFKEGLMNFERDAAELSKIVSSLHVSQNELRSSHEEARTTVTELVEDQKNIAKAGSGRHILFYALLMIEIALFVGFLYLKRPGSAMTHKAYGKYG